MLLALLFTGSYDQSWVNNALIICVTVMNFTLHQSQVFTQHMTLLYYCCLDPKGTDFSRCFFFL